MDAASITRLASLALRMISLPFWGLLSNPSERTTFDNVISYLTFIAFFLVPTIAIVTAFGK